MVSNSLHMTEEELLAALDRIKAAHAADPDYQEMRAALPEDWPM